MGGLPETISELAQRVGGSPTSRQVALAADQRLEFSRELLSDKYSAAYLYQLKARGCRLGIVTDCSAETPLTWNSSWLNDVIDVVTFSCEIGVRKPAPEIYLAATRVSTCSRRSACSLAMAGAMSYLELRNWGWQPRCLLIQTCSIRIVSIR